MKGLKMSNFKKSTVTEGIPVETYRAKFNKYATDTP